MQRRGDRDHEHGGGRAHWEILEDLGTRIGLKRSEIRAATPISTTQLAWAAWEGLMANRHWLKASSPTRAPSARTCRLRHRHHEETRLVRPGARALGQALRLSNGELEFFGLHEKADIEHSDAGWRAVERFAREMRMEDAVVAACERNLQVWEMYLNGIGEAGDRLG